MDVEEYTHEDIKIVQKIMTNALTRDNQDELQEFLKGELSYFRFPQDPLHEKTLREISSQSHRELTIKNNAVLRLLAIRDILEGYVTAYKTENGGEYLREVTPKITDQVGSQGAKYLPYHSDMGYLRFSNEINHANKCRAPDYLALTCIRNSEKVGTFVLDIDIIKEKMGSSFNLLKKNWFSFQSPDSVKPIKKYKSKPIVLSNNGVDLMRWEKCLPSSLEGAEVYTTLYKLLENIDLGENMILKPGETLVFNNRRCLHGRKAIKSLKVVDEPRLLFRVYVNNFPQPEGLPEDELFYRQEG